MEKSAALTGKGGWTPRRLFARRARQHWAEQLRVWRTVLDWTVWIYFIVPALLIGGGTYREWLSQPPEWMSAIPPSVAALPFVLLLFGGRLRTFAEDADVLFLLQRRGWTARLGTYGAIYTVLLKVLTTAAVLVLLLPVLVGVHELPVAAVLAWGLFVWAVRWLYATFESWIQVRWPGWKKLVAQVPAWLACASMLIASAWRYLDEPAALVVGAALALALGALVLRHRLLMRGAFEADVERERKARLASTELLLAGAGVVERKPVVRLKRPFVFRRSGRLFRRSDPGTMLAELRIKSFLRKGASVRLWIGFVSVSTGAMFAAPPWLDLLLMALLPIPAAVWLHGHWKEWFDGDFVSQFRWDDMAAIRGAALSQFWLLAPAVAWLSLIAGWRFAGLPGMLIAAVAGVGCWYMVNGLLGSVMAVRK